MKKKIIDKIDLVIEDILNIQENIDFDTSDTSEYDLDSIISTLTELKAQVASQEEDEERINLKEV
jgi:translation initiation factor 2 beta subunit (eIF-2beta)/eIF-5